MAFDISTARAAQPSGGFDMSTAKAETQTDQEAPQKPDQPTTLSDIGQGAKALGMEAVTGVNRAAAGLLDFLTIDQINNIRSLMGDEAIPTLQEALIPKKGEFAKGTIAEGLPAEIAGTAGEFAAGAAGGQALLKQGVKQLAPSAAGTGARVLTQTAQPSVTSASGFGAASGAGTEVGREVGGETGALIGSVAAPVAAIGAIGGAKALIPKIAAKFGKNIGLINQETGLPTAEFQKALNKKGVQYGSLIDDVDSLPVLSSKMSPDDAVDTIIKRKLLSGATDDVTATLRLEGSRVVPDKLGEEALKQGFKAGNVAAAKGMSPSTKREAEKMLNMTRQILANSSKADQFRPTDVVGKNVVERFKFIRDKADTLRNQLDAIASKSSGGPREIGGPGVSSGLKGLKINTASVEDNLVNEFNKLGIDIPENTVNIASALSKKGAFIGSDISKDKTSQRIIKDVVDLLGEGGSDALRAHKLKRQLDSMIDFNKKSAQGLTDKGKAFAKSIRASLNNAIREASPKYAKINDELSSSIESMNDFQRVLGPSIDVFDTGAQKAIGQDLRGLLSNRKSRVKLENAVNVLDDTAKKLGGDFDVNVRDLVRFANTLDDRFGAVAETGFKGQIASGIEQAARGRAGAVDLGVQKLAEGAEKLRGINDVNALNTMTKILKR